MQIVDSLLKAGARTDIGGEYGIPLTIAASRGYVEVVNSLIRFGASVNIEKYYEASIWTPRRDEDDKFLTSCQNPLFAAAARGHLDIVNVLVEAGASVNTPWHRSTPLSISLKNGHTEIADVLVSAGARESQLC